MARHISSHPWSVIGFIRSGRLKESLNTPPPRSRFFLSGILSLKSSSATLSQSVQAILSSSFSESANDLSPFEFFEKNFLFHEDKLRWDPLFKIQDLDPERAGEEMDPLPPGQIQKPGEVRPAAVLLIANLYPHRGGIFGNLGPNIPP